MKKVFLKIVGGLFALCLLTGLNLSTAVHAEVFTDSLVEQYQSGTKGDYLAGAHSKLELDCNSCHGDLAYVEDTEKTVNNSCISCHGDLQARAKVSTGHLNAHDSHLGIISCTSCHMGHVSSQAYCKNCHAFDMPIAYEGQQPAQMIEQFIYAKAMPNHVEVTDVVVVGTGGSGIVAAITAHDAGAKVIVLEKMPITGGNTQLSAGGMNAAWTRYQKALNIKDSPQSMFDDTMKGGRFLSNPDLVKILAFNSNASIEWLTSKGIILSSPGMGGGATNARFHAPEGGRAVGAYLTQNFKKLSAERNLDIRTNSKAVKVLTREDGSVFGILVKGKHSGFYEIHAKAVVMATGGFSANAKMVSSLQPSFTGMTTSNQPGALGEGMMLGEQVGGVLIDMQQIQIHPTVAVGSQILITEAVRGRGAIMINHEGKRFIDELTTRDKASAAILAQKGQTAFLVFDDGVRAALKQIDGYFELELVKQGSSIEELAKAINVPADNLKQTIATYNDAVKAQSDKEFGRASLILPINKGNYYAIEIAPGVHYTMGGLKINSEAQVLDAAGKPIKGFYAAGEVTGGVHGANRLGGNSISETITFGRIAGANAAKAK